MKFKVGDVVRVSARYDAVDAFDRRGTVGVVYGAESSRQWPYDVRHFDGYEGIFSEIELELVEDA